MILIYCFESSDFIILFNADFRKTRLQKSQPKVEAKFNLCNKRDQVSFCYQIQKLEY